MVKNKKEIERWFVPRYALLPKLERPVHIMQGYLHEKSTVRVRLEGHYDGSQCADITIKGKKIGISRREIVIFIPFWFAKLLLRFRKYPLIEKMRYLLPSGLSHPWEIDVFLGANDGLVKVEIELEDENEKLPDPLPEWIYEEVTHEDRYGNKHLAQNPFSTWPKEVQDRGKQVEFKP